MYKPMNKSKRIVLSVFLFLGLKISAQEKMNMLFVGDIMGHDAQIAAAYDSSTNSYNYEPAFHYMSPFFQQADIVVGNLEVTLAGEPFKGYPQFSSPDALAHAAKDAGIDVLLTANNHCLDRGKSGALTTLAKLDSMQFMRAGSYADSIDRVQKHPVVFEKNGIRAVLLNYTYGTNGLTVSPPVSVNQINRQIIASDLSKAKAAHPDITIVAIHWGLEYENDENASQRSLADFIFEHGADAIIGSHPHVVQPVSVRYSSDSTIKNPVFYSLGNYVSNQRAEYKDGGVVAGLQLVKKNNVTVIEDIYYIPYWVYRNDFEPNSQFYVIPVSYYETYPYEFPFTTSDEFRIKRFASHVREHLKNIDERIYTFE